MSAIKHLRRWLKHLLKQPCVVSAPSAFLGRKPQTEDLKPVQTMCGHISCQECLAQECLANADAKLYNRCPVSKIKHNRLGRKSQTAYVDAMNLQCFASISDTANN